MEWKISDGLTDYEHAVQQMEQRVGDICDGNAEELVWLVEHAPLYTAGTSAKADDLLDAERFPVHQAGRGGQFTYHGPGQRVGYVMLNLKARAAHDGDKVPDVRLFVQTLENWLIASLARFGVAGHIREGRVGVWVEMPDGGEAKVAALGIRIRRGVSYHGVSLNVSPDLSHFQGIVPCGLQQYGVTSLADLGLDVTMDTVDQVLNEEFLKVFESA